MRKASFALTAVCLCLLSCKDAATAEKKEQAVGNPGQDWPCFLGPTHNGVSSEKGIITPWPAQGLRVVWYKEIGTGYSAPSVSGDRLFLFDRKKDHARLTAMDRKTGENLWTFEYPTDYEDRYGYNNGPRCCPVVDGERVYTYGPEGMLCCIDANSGKEVWKVDTIHDFKVRQNFFGVASTPLVEGDVLIAQVGGCEGEDEDRPNGSGIVAFDKLTGKIKYRLGDELASYSSPVVATIAGRRWCFVLARGGLIGFDPTSGKQDFHFPWRCPDYESVNAANPVVADDKVFISEGYGPGSALLKVKPGGCEVIWTDKQHREKSMKAHWTTPILHDGYLFGDSGRNTPDANLRCIELATGKVMWVADDLGHSSLLMVDGHLICLTEKGRLRLLKVNHEKYDEVSRMYVKEPDKDGWSDARGKPLLEGPCWAAPALAHGLLYLRGKNNLVCLELTAPKKN